MQKKPLGNLVCVKRKPNGTVTADIDRMIDRMTYLNRIAMQQSRQGE